MIDLRAKNINFYIIILGLLFKFRIRIVFIQGARNWAISYRLASLTSD